MDANEFHKQAMSTTKIINGCAIDNGQSVFFAQSDKRPTAPWQAATLYIGTGKLWTEDEVNEMFVLMRMVARLAAGHTTDHKKWKEAVEEDFKRIAADHGLTI